MNKLLLSFLFILSSTVFADTFTVSPGSSLNWTGKKLTGQHTGTIELSSGKVEIVNGLIKSGEFLINLKSIVVKDIEDPTFNKKLHDHLLSEDFFNADNFPEAKFMITAATKGTDANTQNISGKLSIKGIESNVTFPAVIKVSGDTATAEGTATLDRTKWNIKYGSGKFFQNLGDKLIYDDFYVELKLSAKK